MTDKMNRRRAPRDDRAHQERGIEVVQSELTYEEIVERYLAQRRARAAAIRGAATQADDRRKGEGSGGQAASPAKPALPDDEPNQAHRRRGPGAR